METNSEVAGGGGFEGVVGRRAVRSRARKQAQAQKDLEKAIARAEVMGVQMRPLPPGMTGSVKGAVRAMVGEYESWGIAHQLVQGAMDPSNPRQLDFISRLKEWIDGLETQKSESSQVQKRVVLNLGGVGSSVAAGSPLEERLAQLESENARLRSLLTGAGPLAASLPQRTLSDVATPLGGSPPPPGSPPEETV